LAPEALAEADAAPVADAVALALAVTFTGSTIARAASV
jgi:hypothetical protein